MRKKHCKAIGLLLVSTCLFSMLLTGCGNGDDAGNSSDGSSDEVNSGDTQSSQASEADDAADTPSDQEKATLTVWAYWTNGDLYSDQGDWEYWQAIEEACNVDLQFLDSSGGKDALSLLAGTDDLPDIIIDYDPTFPGGFRKCCRMVPSFP